MTDIRTLSEGEKITEPGFYAIPLSVHHAQPCDGPSVTSGVLRTMELQTPADVWAFHRLNPNRIVKEPTDALRLGTAMAACVEGGRDAVLARFKVHAEDKPRRPSKAQIEAYDGGKASEAASASVEYWRAVDNDPDTVDGEAFGWLTVAELDTILTMGEVLKADPAAGAVMGGIPEITMAWRDEQTGLWLLSRPDTVSVDGSVSDYKKMNTQGRPFNYRVVDNRITDHAYDMQLAFAAEAFERLTGDWPGVAGIVAQWDQQPHHVILREIAEEDLRIGQFRNRRAINRFHECLTSGHWPGPGWDVGAYQRPQWQREMLLGEMNTEGTAP